MDARDWDRRYAGAELVWGAEPNRWIVQECADLPPGRALDLACGEGRNARWLAGRGWRVTAVDFSRVALDRGAQLAESLGAEAAAASISWVQADLREYVPEPGAHDLVVIAYLQVQADLRRHVVTGAVRALVPGGTLVLVGHDLANLGAGVGGPQDPAVLYTATDLRQDLATAHEDGVPVVIRTAEAVHRQVETADGVREAVDVLLVAQRPTLG